jgi:hypothetical protein
MTMYIGRTLTVLGTHKVHHFPRDAGHHHIIICDTLFSNDVVVRERVLKFDVFTATGVQSLQRIDNI